MTGDQNFESHITGYCSCSFRSMDGMSCHVPGSSSCMKGNRSLEVEEHSQLASRLLTMTS